MKRVFIEIESAVPACSATGLILESGTDGGVELLFSFRRELPDKGGETAQHILQHLSRHLRCFLAGGFLPAFRILRAPQDCVEQRR